MKIARRGGSDRLWSIGAVVVGRGLGLITLTVIARLAGPEELGIVAIAAVAFGALTIFNDGGVGGVLMVDPELTRFERGVCLSLITSWAVGLMAVGLTIAWPTAWLLGEPRAWGVLLVLCASLPFASIQWYLDPVLISDDLPSRRFWLRVVQALTALIVGILCAMAGLGAFSLAWSQFAGSVTYSAVGLTLLGGVKPRWHGETMRRMISRGKGFLAQGGLSFVDQNVDNAIVGRLMGASALGVYSITFRMAQLPYSAVSEPVSQAAVPKYTNPRADATSRAAKYYKTLTEVTLIAGLPCTVLIGGAQIVLPMLLGSAWSGHGGVVLTLGIWSFLRVIQAAQGWFANSQGGAAFAAKVTAIILIGKIPALIFASSYGLTAVAGVMILATFAEYITISVFARHYCVTHYRTLKACSAAFCAVATGSLSTWLIDFIGDDGPVMPFLALSTGSLIYCCTAAALSSEVRHYARVVRK